MSKLVTIFAYEISLLLKMNSAFHETLNKHFSYTKVRLIGHAILDPLFLFDLPALVCTRSINDLLFFGPSHTSLDSLNFFVEIPISIATTFDPSSIP